MTCPICNNVTEEIKIFDLLPYSSAQLSSIPNKSTDTVEFVAGVCNHCSHIHNKNHKLSFIDKTYKDLDYITKKSISTNMSINIKEIINFILTDINLTSASKVLEIGSGSGEISNFLSNISEIITVDPCIESYDNKNIRHYSNFFDSNFVEQLDTKFDLIIARHIIEHTSDPIMFLKLCKNLLSKNGILYIEVPNLISTLNNHRLIDFFYDHVQHFSENSLMLAASQNGLIPKETKRLLNSAHIGIKFKSLNIIETIDVSKNELSEKINELKKFKNIAVYGAGAHSVTFIVVAKELNHKIVKMLDKDPAKTGKYIPTFSVPIEIPTKESLLNIDVIVNTSVLYKLEVETFIRSELLFKGNIIHL